MTLNEYLNSPSDHATGVALYNAHFGEGKWERKFAPGTIARIVHSNLVYELKKLKGKGVNVSVEQAAPYIQQKAITIKKSTPRQKEAEVVQKVEEEATIIYPPGSEGKEMEARDLYRKAGRRRQDLFSDDRTIREAAAKFIVSTMKRNRELWAEINYFRQHGQWPEKADDKIIVELSDKTIPELHSMHKNLGPWLSKEKNKIKNEKDPAKLKVRQDYFDQQKKIFEAVKRELSK